MLEAAPGGFGRKRASYIKEAQRTSWGNVMAEFKVKTGHTICYSSYVIASDQVPGSGGYNRR